MLSSPDQLTFDQLMARFRPLLEVQEAEFVLTTSRESVLRLVDAGTIRAVDVAAGTKNEKGKWIRKERAVRIWRYSLVHILAGRKDDCEIVSIGDMMPHSRPDLLVRELAGFFACTDQHVRNLAEAGEIKTPPISLASGRQLPRFTRESVTEFLSRREIA